MSYPSVAAMKDALGDIIILQAYDPVAKTWSQFTFDQLPVDAQNALFLFVARIPNPPATQA